MLRIYVWVQTISSVWHVLDLSVIWTWHYRGNLSIESPTSNSHMYACNCFTCLLPSPARPMQLLSKDRRDGLASCNVVAENRGTYASMKGECYIVLKSWKKTNEADMLNMVQQHVCDCLLKCSVMYVMCNLCLPPPRPFTLVKREVEGGKVSVDRHRVNKDKMLCQNIAKKSITKKT